MSNDVTVRLLDPSDAEAVARIHREEIASGFLSMLSQKFLARLYRDIAVDCNSVVFVATDSASADVVGFVAATVSTSGLYKRLLARNALAYVVHLLPLAVKPSMLGRILETLWYPFRTKVGRSEATSCSTPEAELLSIAVSACSRRRGLGQRLVAALDDWFVGRASRYAVVTWQEDERANAFYRSRGFVVADSFLHHGHVMQRYLRDVEVRHD